MGLGIAWALPRGLCAMPLVGSLDRMWIGQGSPLDSHYLGHPCLRTRA
jgi:hypothetical protein